MVSMWVFLVYVLDNLVWFLCGCIQYTQKTTKSLEGGFSHWVASSIALNRAKMLCYGFYVCGRSQRRQKADYKVLESLIFERKRVGAF